MTRLARLALVPLALGLLAAPAGAGKGGPSPGVTVGWNGVLAADGGTRYVALSGGHTTTVAAVRVRGGTVLRYASLGGSFGIPLVAYDGSTAGISHDGRTLILGTYTPDAAPGAVTRFAVLRTKSLRSVKTITLRGAWSFDALSPDGRKLYLVEYLTGSEVPGYRVRAYDVERGRLLREPVIDPDEAGAMTGEPVTRLGGPGGAWAYTLYRKRAGTAFVHALDTEHGQALCIDLPWRNVVDAIWSVRMAMGADGRTLLLRQHGTRLAAVDTRTFTVRAFARPRG